MKIKKNFLEKFNTILLIMFCLTHQTVYWYEGNKYLFFIKFLSLIMLFLILIFNIYFFIKNKKEYYTIKLLVVIFLKIVELIFYNGMNIIGNLLTIFIITIYTRKNFIQKIKFYKILENIIFILCFLGIIEYILFNLDIHPKFYTVYNYRKVYGEYFLVGTLNSYISTGYSILKRMQLIYSEPGEFGTLLGMLLLFSDEKLNIKKFIITLAGLFSLSTAFLYFLFMKIIISTKFKKKLLMGFFSLIFFFLLNNYDINLSKNMIYQRTVIKISTIIKNKSLNRVATLEGKKIASDFYSNGKIFFGEGNQALKNLQKKNIRGIGGIFTLLYERGLFGLTMKIILILIISDFFYLKNKKSKFLVYITLLSIFQRPELDDFIYLPIFYSGPIFFDSLLTTNQYHQNIYN